MNDYYLRASSKSHLDEAISSSGVDSLLECAGAVIDLIGPVGADSRYHANLRTQDPLEASQEALLPVIDPPETPYRVWAGG